MISDSTGNRARKSYLITPDLMSLKSVRTLSICCDLGQSVEKRSGTIIQWPPQNIKFRRLSGVGRVEKLTASRVV